jgi:hypothetical protein
MGRSRRISDEERFGESEPTKRVFRSDPLPVSGVERGKKAVRQFACHGSMSSGHLPKLLRSTRRLRAPFIVAI